MDVDDGLPFLVGHLEHRAVPGESRVVHHDVQRAELTLGARDDALPRFAPRNVVFDRDGPAAASADLIRHDLCPPEVDVGARDADALLGQPARDRRADPASGPGDHGNLPLQSPHQPSRRTTEPSAGPPGRAATSQTSVPRWTTSPAWFITSMRNRTTPVPGRDVDGRASSTVHLAWIVSPG